jgi:plastocyanin
MIKKIVFVLIASLALVACTQYGAPQTPTSSSSVPTDQNQTKSDITIQNFTFSPSTVQVSSGNNVSVTNNDSTTHTVTSDDGKAFTTGPIDPGQTVSFLAPAPGSYGFHCNIHKSMTATLVVK